MQSSLCGREVVLWGVGHTNAQVVRMWRMKPIPDVRLTCISNDLISTYSGMLPGVLAGQYPREKMEVDLVRLCAAAGARLIRENVTGLDVAVRQLLFEDRPPLPFDVLSIGIGSVPSAEGLDGGGNEVIAIKPMPTFLDRLEERLRRFGIRRTGRPPRLVVVGGGAGGVEIAFCVPSFAKGILTDVAVEVTLVHSGDHLAASVLPKTNDMVQRRLAARGIEVCLGRRVARVEKGLVTLSDGDQIEANIVIWATEAVAPSILGTLGVPVDARGFLLTRPTLQVVADAPIFVVGDSGTITGSPTPKAGVFAVRQGPVLWRNIAHLLKGRELEPYRPQGTFLRLLNTGDGRAIGEYRGFTFEGRWCRSLKDFIDVRFVDKFQDYRKMPAGPVTPETPLSGMRCTGCGGKIGGAILARVLRRLDLPAGSGVLVGLETPDDAAIVQPPAGSPLALTVDFFAAPLDDAYLVGRLSALHAASDAFAMHAVPLWALAMATLPLGEPRVQEQLLFEWLSGSLREFRRMGVSLVGGHTIEGRQFTVGFTIVAASRPGLVSVKGGFREGDRLILTKPIGTGILLAAQARAMCRAGWMEQLVELMLASNHNTLSLLDDFNIPGVTDVTGFGLAGHLLEALQAGKLDAELILDQIPVLSGVSDLLNQGIESTLAPANRSAEAAISASNEQRRTAAYSALFDPQTCGGLLFGVAESDVTEVLARLAETSPFAPKVIGRLRERGESDPKIRIV